jgi:hypothetical protein
MNLAEKSIRRGNKKQSCRQRQTHMRRANLGNMFAPLLASGWINQLHAQTPSPTTNAKIGKEFHETCQPPQDAIRKILRYDDVDTTV